MKTFAISALLTALLVLPLGCVTKATEQECNKMCEHLVRLRAEIDLSTVAEKIAEVEESYKREEKRLKDWMERDLKSWDEELEAKLATMTDDSEKEALTKEYEEKKEATRKQHLPGIAELPAKKKAAKEEAKKKVESNKAKFADAVAKCTEESLKEGVAQSLAQCRIEAKSVDQYWNVCR